MGTKIRDLGQETSIQNGDLFVIADGNSAVGTRSIKWQTIKGQIDSEIASQVSTLEAAVNSSMVSGRRVALQASMRCSDGNLMRNKGFTNVTRHGPGKYTFNWSSSAVVDNTNQYTVVLTRVWVHPLEGDTIIYNGPLHASRSSTSFTVWNVNDDANLADSETILVAVIV